MSSPDPSAEVQLAVLEERTKVTLTKMGEIVAKLDGLVEQVMEIRSSMPTWQVELQRVADRQSMNETRISVLEGTLSDRLHSLEMKDGNRDAREGVFIAIKIGRAHV